MSSRESILNTVRAHRRPDHVLPEVPLFGHADPEAMIVRFAENLQRMGGRLLEKGPPEQSLAALQTLLAKHQVICSRVPEVAGNRVLSGDELPATLHDVDVAVLRAAFGVAETGSVAFSEQELGINALAYLAQHLVVLLDPAGIVENLHHAFHRPEYASRRYTVLHSGPSATADIEGVLIQGAQGVRSLSVLLLEECPPRL